MSTHDLARQGNRMPTITLGQLIDRIVTDGIAAAHRDYPKDPHKFRGVVEGFEVCRGKTVGQILEIYAEAQRALYAEAQRAIADSTREVDYVYHGYRAAKIFGSSR